MIVEAVFKIDFILFGILKIGFILLYSLYILYPPNNSSAPSPDKTTVTCFFASLDKK